MPPDPGPAAGGGSGEGLLTMPAVRRHHRHDLVPLLDREQPAERPAVSRLAAALPFGRGAFRRTGAWGGSDEGGREEFAEVRPRQASRSRMRSRWARISAWAAHGVAAQISGGGGSSVSSMDWGIRRHRPSRNPLVPGGPERLR
jgi:hypothetical protein